MPPSSSYEHACAHTHTQKRYVLLHARDHRLMYRHLREDEEKKKEYRMHEFRMQCCEVHFSSVNQITTQKVGPLSNNNNNDNNNK